MAGVKFDDADLAIADVLLRSAEKSFERVFAELREVRAMQALLARQIVLACSLHMSAAAPSKSKEREAEKEEDKLLNPEDTKELEAAEKEVEEAEAKVDTVKRKHRWL